MAASFARSVICPVLIGRTSHVQLLRELLVRACAGQGEVVLIRGEAGIGKSRLVAELRAGLPVEPLSGAQGPILVLEGHCFETDGTLPYGPLRDLLRTLIAGRPSDEIVDWTDASASELATLLPDVATTVANLQPSQALDPEGEKRRLFHALAQLFGYLAARQPLVVIVEDLHWSDDTSLELLLQLARRGTGQRMLLVLTYRDEEVHPALSHFLAQLDRDRLATELSLTRLSPEQIGEMLRVTLNRARPLRAAFVDSLHAHTDGNPFFVEEVLKSLISTVETPVTDPDWDREPIGSLGVPRSVRDAVQRRLHHVSPAARDLLALAAVAGRHFDFSLVQQLTQHDERELVGLIKELIEAQLVIEESAERFAFRHALTHEAVYSTLLARERMELHGQLADAVERLYAPTLDAHLADLANHYYRAGAWERALEYSRRAGSQAQRLLSPRAAIEHFTCALEAAERVAGSTRAELLRSRGQARAWIGDFEGARQDYEATLSKAVDGADRVAEWQALIDLGALWMGRDYARGRQYCERALEVARVNDDQRILAHSLNRLGHCAMWTGQPFEAQRYHRQALAVFQELADRGGMAETLELLGTASAIGCDLVEASRHYGQAVDLYRDLDDRRGIVSCLIRLVGAGASGNTDILAPAVPSLSQCVEPGEQAIRLAREIGWRWGEAEAQSWLSFCVTSRGEYERALRLAHASLEIAEEIEHPEASLHGHGALGGAFLGLFAWPAAFRHFDRALALARELRSPHFIATLSGYAALAYLEADRVDRAEILLDGSSSDSPRAETFGERRLWSARAELALARGQPERALKLTDWLTACAPNYEPRPERIIIRLAHLRGRALARLGRDAEAEMALRLACDAAHTQEARGLLWRVQASLGCLYRSQARHAQAERQLHAARVIVEDLAAAVQDPELRDGFRRRASLLLPSRDGATIRRAEKLAFGGLTRRERQVAVLVSQGQNNQAIADALVVGKRTVETHIGNILAKLDVSSRAQIAAWVDEHGPRADVERR